MTKRESMMMWMDGCISAEKLHAQGVRIVEEQPSVMNRIVRSDILNSVEKIDYAMGEFSIRDALLLYDQIIRRTRDNAVEYMI